MDWDLYVTKEKTAARESFGRLLCWGVLREIVCAPTVVGA